MADSSFRCCLDGKPGEDLISLVVTFSSTGELKCGNIAFSVYCPDDELLNESSRPVTVPIFCEGLNFKNEELVEESKKFFVASTFSDELNSGDMDDGIHFVNGELRPEPTRLSVPSPCCAELNRQEGDDCTRCNNIDLVREYTWLFVGCTSCDELDCENTDNSMRCIDDELDKESIGLINGSTFLVRLA